LFIQNPKGIKANNVVSYKEQVKGIIQIIFKGNNIVQFNNSVNALFAYLKVLCKKKI